MLAAAALNCLFFPWNLWSGINVPLMKGEPPHWNKSVRIYIKKHSWIFSAMLAPQGPTSPCSNHLETRRKESKEEFMDDSGLGTPRGHFCIFGRRCLLFSVFLESVFFVHVLFPPGRFQMSLRVSNRVHPTPQPNIWSIPSVDSVSHQLPLHSACQRFHPLFFGARVGELDAPWQLIDHVIPASSGQSQHPTPGLIWKLVESESVHKVKDFYQIIGQGKCWGRFRQSLVAANL